MIEYVGSIEKQTLENTFCRRVLFTGPHSQLVVMCLQPGEAIGDEVHPSKTAPLKLYTIYSPPNHPDGTVHKTKVEAEAAEPVAHH